MAGFIQSFNAQSKLAEFFDTDIQGGESVTQFRQRLVSTTEYYNNKNDAKKEVVEYRKTNQDIKEVSYIVIGYDENLQAHMKSKNLDILTIPMNTEKTAQDLFKRTSDFVKKNLPEKYVDSNGNVWQKVQR